LVGDFRQEYLFELRHCLDLYLYYWNKIEETDRQIEELLKKQISNPEAINDYKAPKNKQYQKNAPKFNVGKYIYIISGVELLKINGVGPTTLLTLISETGLDLSSKFKTGKHFSAWLGFAPNRKITGGKVISSRTPKKTNPLAKAIRDAANSAGNSQSRLGDFFRRLAYRKGRMIAITATARKISIIIYKMLTEGKDFSYEYSKDKQIKNIIKIAMKYQINRNELELALV
jgi:transposase